MLTIDIPGSAPLHLKHLVLDFNGTIAGDGTVLPTVPARLTTLAQSLTIHIVTADTHGTAAQKTTGLPVRLAIIGANAQDRAKETFLTTLGPQACVAIGNGRNDILLLARAALGIAVVGLEGAAAGLLAQADVICFDIEQALDLLIKPDRLRATLRN